MATFEDFLLLAAARLGSVGPALPDRQLSSSERTLAIRGLRSVLGDVERYLVDYGAGGPQALPGHAGNVLAQTADQALGELRAVHRPLRQASNSLLPPEEQLRRPDGAAEGAEQALDRLSDTRRFLTVGRDLLLTQRAPTGEALTPYAAVVSSPGGQLYVMAQMGRVVEQAQDVARALAQRSDPRTDTPSQLGDAAGHLDRAAAGLRAATGGAPGSLAALPAAPHLTPVPALPGESARTMVRHLAGGAERLQTGAFQATHRPDAEPVLTAAALRQSANSIAVGHLLAGRLLHAVGPALAGDQQALTAQAATDLRTAARAWSSVGERWGGVAGERLGAMSDLLDRRTTAGAGVPVRHPAAIEAEALVARTGRLLFGEDWTPADKGAAARPGEQILASAGGAAPLLEAVRRIPAAAAVVAEQNALLVPRITGRLVTVDGLAEQRRDGRQRWFAAQPEQTRAMADSYRAASAASAAADVAVTALAGSQAVPAARAQLDAAARQRHQSAQAQAEPPRITPQQQPGVGHHLG